MADQPFTRSVPPHFQDCRLDRFLNEEAADADHAMGLRGWRRLCASGRVLVNTRPAGAEYKLRAGQSVTVLPASAAGHAAVGDALFAAVRCVAQAADLAAVYKPSGVHSTHLAGGSAPSLAAWLRRAVPPLVLPSSLDPSFVPCLLNRLDGMTSGLVVVARSAHGRELWRAAEREGRVDKWYLAVVTGRLEKPLRLRARLDTADRARTRLVDADDPNPVRHTEVRPIGVMRGDEARRLFCAVPDAAELTLVVCRIHKGARHQIRAHLAGVGYPLYGDERYGGPAVEAGQALLHHARLESPDLNAVCPPDWLPLLPRPLAQHVEDMLLTPPTTGKSVAPPG